MEWSPLEDFANYNTMDPFLEGFEAVDPDLQHVGTPRYPWEGSERQKSKTPVPIEDGPEPRRKARASASVVRSKQDGMNTWRIEKSISPPGDDATKEEKLAYRKVLNARSQKKRKARLKETDPEAFRAASIAHQKKYSNDLKATAEFLNVRQTTLKEMPMEERRAAMAALRAQTSDTTVKHGERAGTRKQVASQRGSRNINPGTDARRYNTRSRGNDGSRSGVNDAERHVTPTGRRHNTRSGGVSVTPSRELVGDPGGSQHIDPALLEWDHRNHAQQQVSSVTRIGSGPTLQQGMRSEHRQEVGASVPHGASLSLSHHSSPSPGPHLNPNLGAGRERTRSRTPRGDTADPFGVDFDPYAVLDPTFFHGLLPDTSPKGNEGSGARHNSGVRPPNSASGSSWRGLSSSPPAEHDRSQKISRNTKAAQKEDERVKEWQRRISLGPQTKHGPGPAKWTVGALRAVAKKPEATKTGTGYGLHHNEKAAKSSRHRLGLTQKVTPTAAAYSTGTTTMAKDKKQKKSTTAMRGASKGTIPGKEAARPTNNLEKTKKASEKGKKVQQKERESEAIKVKKAPKKAASGPKESLSTKKASAKPRRIL